MMEFKWVPDDRSYSRKESFTGRRRLSLTNPKWRVGESTDGNSRRGKGDETELEASGNLIKEGDGKRWRFG